MHFSKLSKRKMQNEKLMRVIEMKKILIILFFIPFIFTSSVSALPVAEGAINGGFEDWTDDNADGWTCNPSYDGLDSQETSIVHGGSSSVEFTVTAGDDGRFYQLVDGIVGSTDYSISFWALDNDADGRIRIFGYFRDSSHSNTGTAVETDYSADDSNWQSLTAIGNPITAPADATEFYFDIRAYNVGDADGYIIYIDDTSIDGSIVISETINSSFILIASSFMIAIGIIYRNKRK